MLDQKKEAKSRKEKESCIFLDVEMKGSNVPTYHFQLLRQFLPRRTSCLWCTTSTVSGDNFILADCVGARRLANTVLVW